MIPTDSEATIGSQFTPGFRLSLLDVLVLIAGAFGTWYVGRQLWWMGAMVGFVVGHFFLFCNVFRIARKSELTWAAVLVGLSSATIAADIPGWTTTVAGSLLLTVVLVVIEMRKPSYHGIGWERLNPNLRTWWEANRTTQSPTTQAQKDQASDFK